MQLAATVTSRNDPRILRTLRHPFLGFLGSPRLPRLPSRPGFVFLIAALVIGIIVSGMAISLVLLGLGAQQSSLTVQQTAQAYENAQTCAERGLRNLRADLSYDGGESFTLESGTCSIAHTGGSGNLDRTLCVTGESGKSTRRLELAIQNIYPAVTITSWREVDTFTLCP